MSTAPLSSLPALFRPPNPNERLGKPLNSLVLHFSLPSNRRFSFPRTESIGRWRRCSEGSKPVFLGNANAASTASSLKDYEFVDSLSEVELRIELVAKEVQSPKDIFVDADELSLKIRVQNSGSFVTLMETNLYDRIKPSETIWYIDEDELVVNLKKFDAELKWPDIMESWDSLTVGLVQLLKGTSIYIVGNSTEINQQVAQELASGIGYMPLITAELLERYAQQPLDSWVLAEGSDSVAEAEAAIIEGLSSQARAVVATLGGQHGAAKRADKWRHLYAGFTIWLSESDATDEASAKDEVRKHIEDGTAYSNAEVVLKLGGWEADGARTAAQACLTALKQLILSDKKLTVKKSLYVRGGCRGDWPNIQPPGCDPSTGDDFISNA